MSLTAVIGKKQTKTPRQVCAALLAAASLAMVAGPGQAENLQAKNRIIDLMLCYGEGTDTIALNGPFDERLEEGIAIYRECFTEDATFNLWLPGSDFDGPPSLPPIQGVVPWAEGVVAGNVTPVDGDGNSLVRDQHMLTNFHVETKGRVGTLTAYLNNTRTIYGEDGAPVSNVISNGTYTLYVEKLRGKWMATELDLKLNSVYVP